jgi:hypothetical protein
MAPPLRSDGQIRSPMTRPASSHIGWRVWSPARAAVGALHQRQTRRRVHAHHLVVVHEVVGAERGCFCNFHRKQALQPRCSNREASFSATAGRFDAAGSFLVKATSCQERRMVCQCFDFCSWDISPNWLWCNACWSPQSNGASIRNDLIRHTQAGVLIHQ